MAGQENFELGDGADDETGKAIAVYVIYLAALFTAVPLFVGVILAYIFKGRAPAWAHSHFDHQISLFWRFALGCLAIGAFIAISVPLIAVLIGIPMIIVGVAALLYLWFWMLLRCIKGIADARLAVPYRGQPGWGL